MTSSSSSETPEPDDTTFPVPLLHPWCPPERPYPESYAAAHRENPDECVAEDPCLPDGSTLWQIAPCGDTTTSFVAVGEPPVPTLPATGAAADGLITAGFLFVVIGIWLVVTGRLKRPKTK